MDPELIKKLLDEYDYDLDKQLEKHDLLLSDGEILGEAKGIEDFLNETYSIIGYENTADLISGQSQVEGIFKKLQEKGEDNTNTFNGFDFETGTVTDEQIFSDYMQKEFITDYEKSFQNFQNYLTSTIGPKKAKTLMLEVYFRYAKEKNEVPDSVLSNPDFIDRFWEAHKDDSKYMIKFLGYNRLLQPEVFARHEDDKSSIVKLIQYYLDSGVKAKAVKFDTLFNFLENEFIYLGEDDTELFKVYDDALKKLISDFFEEFTERVMREEIPHGLTEDEIRIMTLLLNDLKVDKEEIKKMLCIYSSCVNLGLDITTGDFMDVLGLLLSYQLHSGKGVALAAARETAKCVLDVRNGSLDLDYISRELKRGEMTNLDFTPLTPDDCIKYCVEAGVPVFIHGKPGHGKSGRIEQLDPDFIELNLSVISGDVLDGLSALDENGNMKHYKPDWLVRLEDKANAESDRIHILSLEELTNAPYYMQRKAYGIALDRVVAGKWPLPENVRVVAAGNDIDDSTAVLEMPQPLYARFAHVHVYTGKKEFLKWALTPMSEYQRLKYRGEHKDKLKVHPLVYAFIALNGDSALWTKYDRDDPQPFADPRRWKMASDMLFETSNPESLRPIIGDEMTDKFIKFCLIKAVTKEEILENNVKRKVELMNDEEKYATVTRLINTEESEVAQVRNFISKLGDEFLEAFDLQWSYANPERKKILEDLKGGRNPIQNEPENSSEDCEVDQIRNMLEADVSIFLHGKPGVGKSSRVRQIDPDCMELNLNHMDLELLDGLAHPGDERTVHVKPEWLVEFEKKCNDEPDRIHILFIDELSHASMMMKKRAYGIILNKKVSQAWDLPKNARVIAAGNEKMDSFISEDMLEPLYGRFAHIDVITTAKKWLKWAITPDEELHEKMAGISPDVSPKHKIHPTILSYVYAYGDKVLETRFDSENPKPYADPRRWEMASRVFEIHENPDELAPVIGKALAKDFAAFCRKPRITLEEVLSGEDLSEKQKSLDLDSKLATISGFLPVDERNVEKVLLFLQNFRKEEIATFKVQWAHGDPKRLAILKRFEAQQILKNRNHRKKPIRIPKVGTDNIKNAIESGALEENTRNPMGYTAFLGSEDPNVDKY